MRVVVAGGTGFIGTALVQALQEAGHDVVVLSRNPEQGKRRLPTAVKVVPWNPATDGSVEAVDGADAVVNLAGATIARRWTGSAKQLIVTSRLDATKAFVRAIADATKKPKVFVSASAVGYYGPRGDEMITEKSPAGDDFLARVCIQWENEAAKARQYGIRVVTTRFGLVLGDGGALQMMALPFRLFVGGPLGSGRQWVPWIHMQDCIGMVLHALETDKLDGPMNVVGPAPLRNRDFSHVVGRVLRRPSFLPAPAFALRLMLGEMASMVLSGQRVLPEQATRSGYRFRFDDAEAALRDVLR